MRPLKCLVSETMRSQLNGYFVACNKVTKIHNIIWKYKNLNRIQFRNISTFQSIIRAITKLGVVEVNPMEVLYGRIIDEEYKERIEASMTKSFKQWKYFNDRSLGGQSEIFLNEVKDNDEEGPFLRIHGKLEKIRNPNEKYQEKVEIIKTGLYDRRVSTALYKDKCYCAVKGWFDNVKDLRDFEGFEFIMRNSMDIKFKINIRSTSYIQDELYQLNCNIDASPDWHTYHIPFSALTHVISGNATGVFHSMDDLQAEGIGFLFDGLTPTSTDSWKSEFQLDLLKISALRRLDKNIVDEFIENIKFEKS